MSAKLRRHSATLQLDSYFELALKVASAGKATLECYCVGGGIAVVGTAASCLAATAAVATAAVATAAVATAAVAIAAAATAAAATVAATVAVSAASATQASLESAETRQSLAAAPTAYGKTVHPPGLHAGTCNKRLAASAGLEAAGHLAGHPDRWRRTTGPVHFEQKPASGLVGLIPGYPALVHRYVLHSCLTIALVVALVRRVEPHLLSAERIEDVKRGTSTENPKPHVCTVGYSGPARTRCRGSLHTVPLRWLPGRHPALHKSPFL